MKKGFDYVGITISYVCHDGEGNYLMNKRSQNCRDEHGTWDFGGGGLDFGDTVEQTLLKELKEEYCVEPIKYEFIGYLDLLREDKGRPTHWLSLEFLVLVDPAQVKNGEPHKFDDLKWFRLDALPSPLHSVMPRVVEMLKTKIKN